MTIEGRVESRFEQVRTTFQSNFDNGSETGAACCVYIDGAQVVDLWGGVADVATNSPWNADTPALIFSATKGLTTICLLRLVERGEVDLDSCVAKYWPEFSSEGKESITVRWLLAHRAGIPAIDRSFTIDDVLNWRGVISAIVAQKPEWTPGTRHGYHARTFGWIAGEIARRVSGKSLGQLFADEITRPLGVDAWIGLPEEIEPRLAKIHPPDPAFLIAWEQFLGSDTLIGRVMNKPNRLFAIDDRWNTRAYHSAEIPSSNGICSARALAKMYAATIGDIDNLRLLNSNTIETASCEHSSGSDAVLGLPTRYGLGFALGSTLSSHAPNTAFGHAGAGGSLGFADAKNKLAFAYVMNRMSLADNVRANTLVKAVYECLK